MGLSYLSTVLGNHDIRIFDQNLCENDVLAETRKAVAEYDPDVAGISIRNVHIYSVREKFFDIEDALAMTVGVIKEISDNIRIIAGGPGFSLFPRRFMEKEPGIEFGVFLEGETSFPLLLDNLDSPERVRGIFYRQNGGIQFTGESEALVFESLNEPKRDLIDPQQYKEDYAIGVQAKRGCILNCIYCAYVFLGGRSLRLRPPEKVVDEIENLINNYGTKDFSFVDHVFNIPKTHSEQICHELIKRNLKVKWTAWFNEKYMDEPFIDLAIAAGCRLFEFSPDGYGNNSLRWLKKNIDTEDINRVFKLIKKKHGIKVSYNFMLGIPGQDISALVRQLIFVMKLKLFLRGRLKIISFNKLGIDPNTMLEKVAISEGIISVDTDLFKPTFYRVGIISWLSRLKCLSTLLKHVRQKVVKA
jgi:radical SAM superfamily enzyme YgiQ (UPF0313 family)